MEDLRRFRERETHKMLQKELEDLFDYYIERIVSLPHGNSTCSCVKPPARNS